MHVSNGHDRPIGLSLGLDNTLNSFTYILMCTNAEVHVWIDVRAFVNCFAGLRPDQEDYA